jgi:hypothetical protein
MRRTAAAATALVALLALTACNSTERNAKRGATAENVALDASGTAADAASETTVAGAAAPSATAATAAKGKSAAAKTAQTGSSISPEQRAHFLSLKAGKGITKDTISLGIQFADAAAYNAAGSALGGASPGFYTPDDPKGIQNAVIDYFNANGGIAGRQIKPVWHEVLASNAVTKEGRTRDAQEACATYTEDNQVFAIMGSGQWTEPNILECAQRTKTPYVDMFTSGTGIWVSDSQVKSLGDYYYGLSMMTTQRRERALVKSLAAQHFFAPGAKIGLLIENSSAIKEGVEQALKPAIAAAGGKVTNEIVYPDIIESPWQNYVLQFQTSGVTHVIFSASTAESWPTLLFMRGAENQGYRPFYGMSSFPIQWLQTNGPAEQLKKAMGVSWLPSRVDKEFPPVSQRDAICRKLMTDKGYQERSGSTFCDFFFFLKDTLEKAPELTPSGVTAVVRGLGDGFSSTITFGGRTRFAGGRRDGAYLVRNFAWSNAKSSLQHTSDLYESP